VFIRSLGRLSAVGAVDFLKGHPGDLFDYLNSRPAAVARDWSVMSAKERKSITSDTLLAGNFDGLPYAVRDAANRAQLDSDIARVQDVVLGRPGDRAARVRLAADLAIRAAVRARSSPGRYLVEYVPGATPVAAIAVGDPDTARSVTWVVPGMGTYTTDMQLWTQGAQNIWDAQGAAGAPTDRSVIAWIGYATPPVGIEAALGQYASNGAPLLTEAIEGMKAARSTDPPTLNVVAHSYGTTMAADALADTDLGVYSFVMVGSAGIEDHIPDAGALHAMHVYAGEATDDTVAQLGRASRQDPRSPAFGATVFPTDGDAALGLAPVTGHAPVLHSPWDDDIDSSDWARVPADEREAEFEAHMRQHGYLDPGTQSLEEIGMLTARAPSDPDDRLLPLHATPTGYLAAFSKAILLVPPRSALG
jgi:predicted alpha/beta hydrolase family esterase